jgi:hypothetical protein
MIQPKMLMVASITGIIVMLVIAANILPAASAQSNQTSSLDQKLKSGAAANKMKATAAGDLIYVLVCPPNFQAIKDCQVFSGQPVNVGG